MERIEKILLAWSICLILIQVGLLFIRANLDDIGAIMLASKVNPNYKLVREISQEVLEICENYRFLNESNRAGCYLFWINMLLSSKLKYKPTQEVNPDLGYGDCKAIAVAYASLLKRLNLSDEIYIAIQLPPNATMDDVVHGKAIGHACVIFKLENETRSYNCEESWRIVARARA
ncbi:MAG: hypothetical protein DRJ35_02870 [Thermoprotei archaeon]|nr:MAG: hypothetical protein DRJ35_02870 [Thermoprotei archaeon]